MDNNINKKLEDILGGIDKSKLNGRNMGAFLNSPEGQRLKNSLSAADKQKILNVFAGLDTNEVKRKLSGADFGALSKMSASDIADKLKKL